MKNIYGMTSKEIFEYTESSGDGLNSEQVKAHVEKYGYNELAEGKKKSKFVVFLEQFKDYLVIILIIAAIISMALGDFESGLVIIVVIVINAILGTVQHIKAEQSLESLKKMSAPNAKVIRNGEAVIVPSREVLVGDVVMLDAGDFVCADGYILENASLKIDESALTGESVSVEKEIFAEPSLFAEEELPLGDRKNLVFSGSFVTYGRGRFIVTSTGMKTEVGKIATLLKTTSEKKTPLQVNLDNFGKKLSVVIMIICAIVFVLELYGGDTIGNSFMFAVALAVAAIPEALSSIVTIVLAFGTQKMAKENAIIRKLQAVEGLGSVSIICSDKTGTLTQNKMTVTGCYGNEEDILLAGVLCNDSSNKDGVMIGDPTEIALVDYGLKEGLDFADEREKYPRLSEVPFDSDRKLMSTVHLIDGKYTQFTKGAVDVLLNRTNIAAEDKNKVLAVCERYSRDGLRVLAFASKELKGFFEASGDNDISEDDEYDMEFIGVVAMMDPPREESIEAVRKCINAGIKPVMITGDHKITAAAIAKTIGILHNDDEAIEGAAIENLTDEELMKLVPKVSVYARVSPEHKIRIVNAWQNLGNIVAMTGDGVNDAPALKQADIGVAMGITGSETAKDAAAMVLTDDNFATIVSAVENGRNIYANIKKSIKFLLSGNIGAIIAVMYASIAMLPVPFTAVHLLFINLLTDSLPAIALGLDPYTSTVMREKPRPRNESILTKDFMAGIMIEGIVISIVTMLAFHIGLGTFAGIDTGSHSEDIARTMAFATLCLSRLLHGFTTKSGKWGLFSKQTWNNKYMYGAFFIGFILLHVVMLVPFLMSIFTNVEIGIQNLLAIYILSLIGMLINNQIVLKILRKDN